MDSKVTFILFLILGFSAGFQCDLEEKCSVGNLLGSITAKSYKECLNQCKDLETCGFVTFFDQIELCELFENCQETEDCNGCTSGEVQCSTFSCDLQGLCLVSQSLDSILLILEFLHSQGQFVDILENTDSETCGKSCFSNPKCNWYSYKPSSELCLLFENCPALNFGKSDYFSSQKECWQPENSCEFLLHIPLQQKRLNFQL